MTAEEIKQKRLDKGLTQEQLAHKLGVSVATVQRWEKEHHEPSPMAVKRIQKVLR